MPKKTFFCFACEHEFTVSTDSKDEIKHCCFCGEPIDEDDSIEEESE